MQTSQAHCPHPPGPSSCTFGSSSALLTTSATAQTPSTRTHVEPAVVNHQASAAHQGRGQTQADTALSATRRRRSSPLGRTCATPVRVVWIVIELQKRRHWTGGEKVLLVCATNLGGGCCTLCNKRNIFNVHSGPLGQPGVSRLTLAYTRKRPPNRAVVWGTVSADGAYARHYHLQFYG